MIAVALNQGSSNKLALSDPQGVSEAFQGVHYRGSKGGRWGNESSLNLGDNVN